MRYEGAVRTVIFLIVILVGIFIVIKVSPYVAEYFQKMQARAAALEAQRNGKISENPDMYAVVLDCMYDSFREWKTTTKVGDVRFTKHHFAADEVMFVDCMTGYGYDIRLEIE